MNYFQRLAKLRAQLSILPCDGLLIEHPIHLLYLTGLELSVGKLLVTQDHACLIVDGRYFETSSKQKIYPTFLLKNETLKEKIFAFQICRLGFDHSKTTYETYIGLIKLSQELQSLSYALDIIPAESVVQKLQLIKERDEIDCLKKAAKLGYEGYQFVSSLLEEGITEEALALELEIFWKKKGAKKLAFDSIIAFGSNSSMPHYRAGKTALKKNSPVLIDCGVVLSHYHSDMTRVVFFEEPSPLIQTIYEIVKEAKEKALALCKPGTLVGELDQAARGWISDKGYGEFFTHSLGHGIGLDIHEPPIIRAGGIYEKLPLQPGMTFTIEPGIYLPNVGGVRLEDTILITEKGYENLTA